MNITAIVSLCVVGCALLVAADAAGGVGCDSCGAECASACGTRHFRPCCMNYMRRKRIESPQGIQMQLWLAQRGHQARPLFLELPEDAQLPWSDEDPAESRVQLSYAI